MLGNPGHLSPRRGHGETEANLPLLHRQDRGTPQGVSEPGVTQQARAGRLDAPPVVACTGHWPRTRTSPMPDLSSFSALREWLLAARPLLLGKQYSCTLYLV